MDDKYQITVGFKVDDNDADINRKIDSVIDKCVEAKTAAAEVEQELKKVLMSKTSYKVYGKDELTEAGKKALEKAKERFETEKAAKAAKDALEAEKQRNKEIAQRNKEVADLQNKLRNLGKGWPNPFEFLSAKNGLNFGGMLARFGRKHPAAAGLANIFNNWRAVWNFVDGIAELNKQLM